MILSSQSASSAMFCDIVGSFKLSIEVMHAPWCMLEIVCGNMLTGVV